MAIVRVAFGAAISVTFAVCLGAISHILVQSSRVTQRSYDKIPSRKLSRFFLPGVVWRDKVRPHKEPRKSDQHAEQCERGCCCWRPTSKVRVSCVSDVPQYSLA